MIVFLVSLFLCALVAMGGVAVAGAVLKTAQERAQLKSRCTEELLQKKVETLEKELFESREKEQHPGPEGNVWNNPKTAEPALDPRTGDNEEYIAWLDRELEKYDPEPELTEKEKEYKKRLEQERDYLTLQKVMAEVEKKAVSVQIQNKELREQLYILEERLQARDVIPTPERFIITDGDGRTISHVSACNRQCVPVQQYTPYDALRPAAYQHQTKHGLITIPVINGEQNFDRAQELYERAANAMRTYNSSPLIVDEGVSFEPLPNGDKRLALFKMGRP